MGMQNLAEHVHAKLGRKLTRQQVSALECYEQELLAWNTRFNLTAIRQPTQVRVKHFLDSLTCLTVIRGDDPVRLIDVGSGAGFPGLVLKIVQPSIRLTLVDSVGKKIEFCRHLANRLSLEQVQVIQERAENIGHLPDHRQKYDWVVARAVAALPVLVEYLLPLAKVNGSVLAMKGENGPAEAHDAEYAINLLGGHLRQLLPVTLPGVVEERYLILIDKIAATPPAYPRRVGVPSKRPLTAKN